MFNEKQAANILKKSHQEAQYNLRENSLISIKRFKEERQNR